MMGQVNTSKVGNGEPMNLSYLLLEREKFVIRQAKRKHLKQFGTSASANENCFVYLLDTGRVTSSGSSGRIPTFRTQSAKVWHIPSNTWLTQRSKLASLGYPFTPETALAMGVPIVPCADSHRAATQAGNCFNFATVGVVQLVALVCLKLLPVSSDTKSDMDSSSSSS